VEGQLHRGAVARGRGDEVDRAPQGAGAVGQRVGAMGDDDAARVHRIHETVVVVAVGGGHGQPVLEQPDAVVVVVGGIEVGAAAGQEDPVAAGAALRPHPGYVA